MVLNTHSVFKSLATLHQLAAEESGQMYPLVQQGLAASTRLILHFQEAGKKLWNTFSSLSWSAA